MVNFVVLVNVYNEEKNIFDFLTSLQNQTYKNFKTIIVDDWSEDNTLTIVEQFKTVLDLSIHSLSHVWLTVARKFWYDLLEPDMFVTIFDADEIIDKNYMKNLSSFLADNNQVYFFSGRRIPFQNWWVSKVWRYIDEMLYYKDFHKGGKHKVLMWWSMSFLKKECDKIGWLRSWVIEDAELTERVLKSWYPIYSTDKCFVFHKYSTSLISLLKREMRAGYLIKNQKLLTLNNLARFSSLFLPLFLPYYYILLCIFWKYNKKRDIYILMAPILMYLLWLSRTIWYLRWLKRHEMY